MKIIALLRGDELRLVEVKPEAASLEVPSWVPTKAGDAMDDPVRLDRVVFRPSGALDPKRREVWTVHGEMPAPDVARTHRFLRVTGTCMASVCTGKADVARARPALVEKFQHMLGTTEVQLLSVTTQTVTRQSGRGVAVDADLVSHRATARGVLPWMVTP